MNVKLFIENFRLALGDKPELPIAFWYSDVALVQTPKIGGCFLKSLTQVRLGETISLSSEVIGCGGGKFYTGFTPMPEHVPNFVSVKERYKQTPKMVIEFLEELKVPQTELEYLNFTRIDNLDSFDNIEGLLFLVTPDILSGLATWSYFDNNDDRAVQTLFGSGCCAIVTQAIKENRAKGSSTYVGLLDPSARINFDKDLLSYVIPMSRFTKMYHTIRQSCLFDTHAWNKIKERINN